VEQLEDAIAQYSNRNLSDRSAEGDAETERLAAAVRRVIRRLSDEDVIGWARNQDPLTFEGYERLWALYEVLAPDAAQWEELFATEFDRVFERCQNDAKPKHAFALIWSFNSLEDSAPSSLATRIRQRLTEALQSPDARMRRLGVFLIDSFAFDDDPSARQAVMNALHDSDWRVRVLAADRLSDANLLQPGYRLSLMDRLRRRYLDYTDLAA
jgi:hypothetical protein